LIMTAIISLLSRPKPETELVGLVYSLTPRQTDSAKVWYKNPLWLGVIVVIITVVFNIIFY
jgi:solute:Na+ symporter, SSS family